MLQNIENQSKIPELQRIEISTRITKMKMECHLSAFYRYSTENTLFKT